MVDGLRGDLVDLIIIIINNLFSNIYIYRGKLVNDLRGNLMDLIIIIIIIYFPKKKNI